MPAHPNYDGLCLNHAPSHAHHRAEEILQRAGDPSGVPFAAEINQSLRKLYEALAGIGISPRRRALALYRVPVAQAHAGEAEARLTD